MPPPVFATLATQSHMAYVRVLAQTLRKHHPEARLYALVVDHPNAAAEYRNEAFQTVALEDLRIPDCRCFCFQYDAFELCNALKPFLLLHLLRDRNECPVLYLDSDIGVYGDLSPLLETLASHDVLLTPHTQVDYPADDRAPNWRELLLVGQFNAGVVGAGAGKGGRAFVEWWANRARHDALVATAEGLFVDQKFLDSVPCLFPGACICRHDGVNVAHFNLHGRTVRREPGGWFVNGVPLLLFHFTMVQHLQGNFRPFVTRPLLEEQPALRELLLDYGRSLEAAGQAECSRLPFGLGTFANGRPISNASRRAFRLEFIRGKTTEDPYSDASWIAFEDDQAARLVVQNRFNSWLRQPRAWKNSTARQLEQLAVGIVKRRRAEAAGKSRTPTR